MALVIEWTNEAAHSRQVPVPHHGLIIGRSPSSDLVLSDPKASWTHARIERTNDAYVLTDLASSNGTQLNGQPLAAHLPHPLQPGDCIRIAGLTLMARASESDCLTPRQTRLTLKPGTSHISVGRDPSSDLALTYPDVSWRHAVLTRVGDAWQIQDLGSTNGTFVNNQRVTQAYLKPGDRIRIGLTGLDLGEGDLTSETDVGEIGLEAVGLTQTGRRNGLSVELLHNVTLSIRPRELVAIAGASGAGKTTLLLALNGSRPATSGSVLLNGVDLYENPGLFRTTIGFVPQEDLVHSGLVVEKALWYAAKLRLPPDTSDAEIADLVTQVLAELGLSDRRTQFIHLLSGGERKRVNIAMELLTRPSLMFLDEPTSGLDAGLERRIVHQLRSLAGQGRTILVVTHSVQTLDEYDHVAFLAAGGYLAFYGPPRDALRFFGVSDYAAVYDALDDPSRPGSYWSDRFCQSGSSTGDAQPAAPPHGAVVRRVPAAPPRTPALRQFGILAARYANVIRSDMRNLVFWLAQAPIIAFLIAILFGANTFQSSQLGIFGQHAPIEDAPMLLFLLAFSAICFGIVNASREIVKERAIYLHERRLCVRPGPYLASKILLLGLFSLLQSVALVALVSLKISFELNAGGITSLLAILFLGAVCGVLIGLLISALASSSDQAISIVAAVLLVQVIFSGLRPLEKMDGSIRWIAACCPSRWSYGGLCGIANVAEKLQPYASTQIHEVLQTSPENAVAALLAITTVLTAAALWAVSHRSAQGKTG